MSSEAMHEAVVVATARTAIGTAFKGSLVDVDAFELGTGVVAEVVRRSGIDPEHVDDVVLGESLYGGGDIARYAAIEAGMEHVPGVAANRHCATSLATIQHAAASVRSGMDRVVVAGGVQSFSTAPAPPGACRARTTGRTGCRPPTGTPPRPPTWTCPSPWGGTRRSRRA